MAVDPSCPLNPKAQWQVKLKIDDFMDRLSSFLGFSKDQSLISISLNLFPSHPRIEKIKLWMGEGDRAEVDPEYLRRIIGYQEIRSTWFDAKIENENIIFLGRGYGHGVGLCQWGSRELGLKGFHYRQILSHYYPQAQIRTN